MSRASWISSCRGPIPRFSTASETNASPPPGYDLAIIDRDQPLRGNAIALVSVDGVPQLVRIRRKGGRFTLDDLPTDDVPIDYLGLGSRLIRFLLPEKGLTGQQRL